MKQPTILETQTNETRVRVALTVAGTGTVRADTGVPFFDHLVHALGKHARFDLDLECRGDVHVDDHHTVEDCALALGRALDQALGDRAGIARFGSAYAPLDEALVRAVVDLSGRGFAQVDLPWRRPVIGGLAMENVAHALRSFATTGRFTLHVDCLRGENDHHRAEAAFKAVALALRTAVRADGAGVPSTKGVL